MLHDADREDEEQWADEAVAATVAGAARVQLVQMHCLKKLHILQVAI